jgi:hypothetical protein
MRFIKSKRNVVTRMIEHIGLYGVMEVLVLIGWDENLGQINDMQVRPWRSRGRAYSAPLHRSGCTTTA